jgi:peroxin-13
MGNSYGMGATNYGYNGYSSYGSPFGMNTGGVAGGGYGAYGGVATNNSSNFFVRAAEESSRNAFQSIESVVHAFSAVSAMFESTYYAVYNSFRAVVGVADQFYRLKTHLSGIVSALAILRVLKYFYRRCLRFLRQAAALVRGKSLGDASNPNDAWSIAKDINDSEKFVKETLKRQTNWPLIMFLGVVLGGPYLIWRILSSLESLKKDDTLWMTGKIDHFVAVSEHDFDAVNVDEISFKRGQRITIAPKEYQPKLRGWLLGSVDGITQGIMPANYLKILGKKIGSNLAKNSEKTQ